MLISICTEAERRVKFTAAAADQTAPWCAPLCERMAQMRTWQTLIAS